MPEKLSNNEHGKKTAGNMASPSFCLPVSGHERVDDRRQCNQTDQPRTRSRPGFYATGALSHPGERAVHDWLVKEAGIFRDLHPLGAGCEQL